MYRTRRQITVTARVWRCVADSIQALVLVSIFLGVQSLSAQAGAINPALTEQAAVTTMPSVLQTDTAQGALMLENQRGEAFWAPVLETDVSMDISGLTASVRVAQSFRNASADWMAARYQFPLPDKAAVHRMVLVVGERRIVGMIKEKREAAQIYQAAKRKGQRASLVSQQRPNFFTTKVANVAPGKR